MPFIIHALAMVWLEIELACLFPGSQVRRKSGNPGRGVLPTLTPWARGQIPTKGQTITGLQGSGPTTNKQTFIR